MQVIVVEPFKAAYTKDIEGSLESMQALVGGYIEAVYPFEDEVAIVCDEEAKLTGKQANRALTDERGRVYDIICGTFFIAGLGEEDFTDVPEALVDKYLDMYKAHDEFIRIGRKVYMSKYLDSGKCIKFMEEVA